MTQQVCRIANAPRFVWALFCALAAGTLGGCALRSTPVSDVDQATALITRTFDEWKNGASLDAQALEITASVRRRRALAKWDDAERLQIN